MKMKNLLSGVLLSGLSMTLQSKIQEFATSFGDRRVAEEEKQQEVNAVFSTVAGRYDLMNDLMSGGLHHAWKDALIDRIQPTGNMHLLDVAGGTADIAVRFLKRGGGMVTIADINPDMLREGQRKATNTNLLSKANFIVGNAESLPVGTASHDAYTIAFGIRNVTHLDKALSEAYRALKFGGHFLCLEFSSPVTKLLEKIYAHYSDEIIPLIGEKITGSRDSYAYLVESIRRFPDRKSFAGMMKEAGFYRVKATPMTGGIVSIHEGWKC